MTAGLQAFNENGKLDVDITDRLPRFLGKVRIDGTKESGTIYNSGIRSGTNIWWFILSPTTNFTNPEASNPKYEYPVITQGEGCLSWKFPAGRKLACTLLYGVY